MAQSPTPSGHWRWGAAAAVVVVIGVSWWLWGSGNTSSGTPRLVVDRTEVDLGYLRYETPARVVFTLTNAGDGLLRLHDVPPVQVVKGC